MAETDRSTLMRSYGDGMSRAFELAATPAIFAFVGWLLDGWMGMFPTFTIAFAVFGVVGTGVRAWFSYDADMRAEEEKLFTRVAGKINPVVEDGPGEVAAR